MNYLIVGLGNPGVKYAKSRHNLGFMVVRAFAKKQGWHFKRSWRLKGKIAYGDIGGEKIYLLLPDTYMNLSGKSVRKVLDYYKVILHNLIVVADDIYLKFGMMRLKTKGSSGGHKGFKSLEDCLKTQDYSRLRIGVGHPQEKQGLSDGKQSYLQDYVLGSFSSEEQATLPQVIKEGVVVLEGWLKSLPDFGSNKG